ncbi:zinc finger SWIM domain-containing protein 7-like isoform X2 [Aphidius gifuensis]|uniref:zinc finger SWIM domain-containing protein 7-like isoform X2 n=1 Tax=Aphidius gifuensis TaxID=684658 RepID=UPI001CDBCE24|nr:zinc finger SWIM domain-containing protein 7-like isoform X2 [Aphidius gifuensis]
MNKHNDNPSTSTTIDNIISQEFPDIAKHVLQESAVEFLKQNKYSILKKLVDIFGDVFERALKLYETKRVTKIIAFDPVQKGTLKDIYESRWLIEVKGLTGECYTLFPNVNFCSCYSFRYHVLGDQSELTCKHLLAAWLANLDTKKLNINSLTPVQFKNLLHYQVTYIQDESTN